MDKWFAVQASIPRSDALDRVQALTRHNAFSFANPNRVRALIGAFSTANQVGFNRADGAGYVYLAETVASIDKDNSRLAARLATALRAWRSLEAGRRSKGARSVVLARGHQDFVSRCARYRRENAGLSSSNS